MKHDLVNPACECRVKLCEHRLLPEKGRCYRCGRPDASPDTDDCSEPYIRRAAVSLVKRQNKYVVVYNERYAGWGFPGGLVEKGERCIDGQRRELDEETGLKTLSARLVFVGRHNIKPKRAGRAGIVYLYEVEAYGEPVAMETPVGLMSREDFLNESPYAPFYTYVFGCLDERERIKGLIRNCESTLNSAYKPTREDVQKYGTFDGMLKLFDNATETHDT